MAATNVKCVWFFENQTDRGFSETHTVNLPLGPPQNLAGILQQMQQVMPARAALLTKDVFITGLRASYPVPGGVAAQDAEVTVAGTFVGEHDPDASLALQIRDATFTRKKVTHLRGFPVSIIHQGMWSPTFGNNGQFLTLINSYFSQLTGGNFGWPARLSGATGSYWGIVSTYTQNADGTITFSLTPNAASGPAPPVNQVVTAVFSKLNHSQSVLNRSFPCTFTAAAGAAPAQLTTVNQVAAGAFQARGKFKVPLNGFLAYATINRISLGDRRMGKPSPLIAGRARRRPTT